jgi:5-methylcytosine-specific restriction endonuclease McrA
MARAEFTKLTKRMIWARARGYCDGCGADMTTGKRCQYDHVVACANGGDNSAYNGQLLCIPCHKAKSGVDAKREAKIRRIRDRARGISPRRSRGISYRKFDGTPVRRM